MQVCTSLQTDNHASTPPLSFLQAGCPSCRPTNSVKALKAHMQVCTSLQAVLDQICRVAFSYPPDGHEGIIAMQRDCMIPPTMVASPYAVG